MCSSIQECSTRYNWLNDIKSHITSGLLSLRKTGWLMNVPIWLGRGRTFLVVELVRSWSTAPFFVLFLVNLSLVRIGVFCFFTNMMIVFLHENKPQPCFWLKRLWEWLVCCLSVQIFAAALQNYLACIVFFCSGDTLGSVVYVPCEVLSLLESIAAGVYHACLPSKGHDMHPT